MTILKHSAILRILVIVVLAQASSSVLGQEPAGSADHPLLSRFPGSTIIAYDARAHDQSFLPSQSSHAAGDWVAGKFTWIAYRAPSTSSALQLYRNYEKALSDAGFAITFTCRKIECGSNFVRDSLRLSGRYISNFDNWVPGTVHYIAAKSATDAGNVWVSLMIYEFNQQGLPIVRQEVIEENEPRTLDLMLGTTIGTKDVEYDEARIAAGKSENRQLSKVLDLEGKVNWQAFRYNRDVSAYEAFIAWVKSAKTNKDKNYDFPFACARQECGTGFIKKVIDLNGMIAGGGERWSQDSGYYFLATSQAAGTETNVSFLSYRQPNGLTVSHSLVVTSDIPDFDKITVNAEALATEIEKTGKVAVYGIYFETDKAELTADSKPTLDEITRLLGLRPDLSLFVDGHTDNQGADDYNLDLSKRRAAAVVQALVNDGGVGASRLEARGFGAGSPVETNDTNEGRARNRRVELVAK